MKIIAFSTYFAIASASASPFQLGQRLRGNQETRELELDECDLERSSINGCHGLNTGQAYKPTSNHSNFSIDGTFVPWDGSSCGIPMWEAGDSDKIEASRAFLNYDCQTGELCILVSTTTDGIYLEEDTNGNSMWLKVDPINSARVPLGGGQVQTIRDDDDRIIAWEACYSMAPTCLHKVQIHANFYQTVDGSIVGETGRTTSTGKPSNADADATIALDLHCPCDVNDDCKIDACYESSTCLFVDGTDPNDPSSTIDVGVCEYSVEETNCCVDDEGCNDDTCVIINGNETGTCQHNQPTPLPTPEPTAHPGPTTPSPTGEGVPTPTPTPFNACTKHDDCVIDKGHPDCAVPICNLIVEGNTCGEKWQNTGGTCKGSDSEVDNTCYQPICDGIHCVDEYLAVDVICKHSDNDCVDYKCKADSGVDGRTTCEGVPKLKGTDCNTSRNPNGPCDRGDKCDGAGSCSHELSFKNNNEVCSPSKANIGQLCDAPEYCTGYSHDCPEDKNYGDDGAIGAGGTLLTDAHVCRSSGRCASGDCVDDVEEVCPGGTSECPADIIFQRVLDIIAAQHHTAGSTTISVTDLGQNSVQVCVNIALDEAWELQPASTGEYSIKYDIQPDEEPKSSPGSYAEKYQTLEEQANHACFSIRTSNETCTMYFALHLDVQMVGEPNTGETAWATLATDDETAESSLNSWPFVKKGTLNGPKVKDGVGWGGYFSFSICCATVDVATTCPGIGTNVTSPIFTCTGDDETATQLTCQHNANQGEVVGCHNLFG